MHRLSFVHRAPALGTTTARSGGTAKRRRFRRSDDVHHDASRPDPVRIHGHGSVRVHTQSRGIDHHFEIVRIGRTEQRSAVGCGGHGLDEVASATLVDIEYGKCPGARRCDRKCDCSASAAGANEKDGFVRGVVAFPLHSKHATQAIEHGADPAPVVTAANDVERANLAGRRVLFVDKVQHPLLMRHRDEQAGEISHRARTRDECVHFLRLDHKRDANRVDPLLDEKLVEQLRGLCCCQWFAH